LFKRLFFENTPKSGISICFSNSNRILRAIAKNGDGCSRESGAPAARLPPSIRQSRACARKSTALTTKPPGGGEEAHRRWPEGRSERGASKAKQRPPGGTTSVSSDSRGEAAPIRHPLF